VVAFPQGILGGMQRGSVSRAPDRPLTGTPMEHFLDRAVAVAVVPQGIRLRTPPGGLGRCGVELAGECVQGLSEAGGRRRP